MEVCQLAKKDNLLEQVFQKFYLLLDLKILNIKLNYNRKKIYTKKINLFVYKIKIQIASQINFLKGALLD